MLKVGENEKYLQVDGGRSDKVYVFPTNVGRGRKHKLSPLIN